MLNEYIDCKELAGEDEDESKGNERRRSSRV
jgi:hypothetical protein